MPPMFTSEYLAEIIRQFAQVETLKKAENPRPVWLGEGFQRRSTPLLRPKPSPSICPLVLPVEAPQFRLQPPHSHTQRRNLRGAFVAQLD